MNESKSKGEFPKQFRSFACEMRFFPTVEIDEEIKGLHKAIRKDLPFYRRGTKIKPDESGLQEIIVHQIESENGNFSLSITINNLIIRSMEHIEIDDFIDKIQKYSKIFFKDHFKSINEIIFLGIRITLNFNFDALTQELEEIINYFEIGMNKDDIIENNISEFSFEKRYELNKVNFKKFIGFRKDNKINVYFFRIDLDSNKGNIKFHPDKINEFLLIHKNNLNTELTNIVSKDLNDIFDTKQSGD